MAAKPPSAIGKYQVESELGRGGFGRVYKAFDPTVGRPVAIKILTALDSPEILARFQAEATATGNLHHPNIVTIYELGIEEGSPYIVMEYLEGQDLQQAMATGRPASLLDKIRIMTQVAQGLQCAHENGVVHRDVKPSNIRLLPGGNVKVMDFGIARLVHDSSERLTRGGFLIGTVLYMSPEQFRGQDADALCDIFAYGLVFYELLSGKHPFQATDLAVIMTKVLTEEPAVLSEVALGRHLALGQVIMRALEKDRERRYQSFADLLLDLQPVLLDLQKEKAGELFTEARELLNSERIVEAQAMVRNIVDLDPANPEVRELRAQVEQSLRQMSARAQIEAALKAVEGEIARGQFDYAIGSLESATRLDPSSPEVAKLMEEARAALQREQKRRTEEPPNPSGEGERAAGFEGDRTVLVDPKKMADFAPPPEKPDAAPPRDVTAYFGKPGSDKPLSAYVTILSCPDSFREGQTIPIQSFPFMIGRSQSELRISEDRTLSRQHAAIDWNGSGYIIRDLGSPNGTYLNGRRIPLNSAEPLLLNAEIRLSATTRLRFRCDISELPDFTGQKLADRYTLEKCLRAGRKSALYEGADSRPIRKVAVKLLSPTLATYPGYLDQFEREAQTAAELDHPNICRIYEHGRAPLAFSPGETKPVHYLCMQMLDGGSLAERLDAPEHGTPAAVAGWLDIVSDALARRAPKRRGTCRAQTNFCRI